MGYSFYYPRSVTLKGFLSGDLLIFRYCNECEWAWFCCWFAKCIPVGHSEIIIQYFFSILFRYFQTFHRIFEILLIIPQVLAVDQAWRCLCPKNWKDCFCFTHFITVILHDKLHSDFSLIFVFWVIQLK